MAVWSYPQIDPVLLEIGPVALRYYGLAYVLGLLFATWMLRVLNRRWGLGLTSAQTWDFLLAAAVGVFVGGRLGYVLFYNLGHYLENPADVIAIWDGGMSFHGGLAGAVAAALLYARTTPVSFLRVCDVGAVGVPVGLFLGRVSNFINGELWGRTSDVPWAMVFPGGGPAPRHPSQLYEALAEGLVVFGVMLWLARRKRPAGTYLGVFMVLYGILRFALEFVREPDAHLGFVAGGLTMGQVLSVPLVLLGVWLVLRAGRRGDEEGTEGAGEVADAEEG